MSRLLHLQGLLGVTLVAVAAGFYDWRAGLAVAGALLFADYVIERRATL